MLSFRNKIYNSDIAKIRELLISTGFFEQAPDEIDIATELAELALKNGNNIENYDFVFAEENSETVGYACFARVPCSLCTFEMYWLCVDKKQQGKSIGKKLVEKVIEIVKQNNGVKLILQTAGREQYRPTQMFYSAIGFTLEARIKNYYAIGDDCLTYSMEF